MGYIYMGAMLEIYPTNPNKASAKINLKFLLSFLALESNIWTIKLAALYSLRTEMIIIPKFTLPQLILYTPLLSYRSAAVYSQTLPSLLGYIWWILVSILYYIWTSIRWCFFTQYTYTIYIFFTHRAPPKKRGATSRVSGRAVHETGSRSRLCTPKIFVNIMLLKTIQVTRALRAPPFSIARYHLDKRRLQMCTFSSRHAIRVATRARLDWRVLPIYKTFSRARATAAWRCVCVCVEETWLKKGYIRLKLRVARRWEEVRARSMAEKCGGSKLEVNVCAGVAFDLKYVCARWTSL